MMTISLAAIGPTATLSAGSATVGVPLAVVSEPATYAVLAGTLSVNTTLVTGGPLLVSTMVHSTVSPGVRLPLPSASTAMATVLSARIWALAFGVTAAPEAFL